MDYENKNHDCSRGCIVERDNTGVLQVGYNSGCCKLSDFDWLEGIDDDKYKDLYEVYPQDNFPQRIGAEP